MTLQRVLGKGLDRLVLRTMSRFVASTDYTLDRAEGETILAESGLGDPSRFFPSLPPLTDHELSTRLIEERPLYSVSEFRLRSPVQDALPPNDLMTVRRFRPRRHRRGRVIVLHGAMVRSRFPWDRMARQLAERDIEALVPSMPDHFERTPAGEYSGQYLVGGHLVRGPQLIRQGVTDVRALVRLLRSEGDEPIGIVGFSMGGLIGGWTITPEPLDFAVLAEPAVELAPIVYETDLGEVARRSLGQSGWSSEDAARWLKALSPVSSYPLLPPDRLLLVLPEHDCFVPPHAVERAWELWGRPDMERYPAGHISLFILRRPWRDILVFAERWCPPRD
ncbi:MAG TPA: alpha/beta hydrolase family protein [Anaerolineae bacterium]|nr:alpha/beta hydrolase family protein [Anaerolineae bacterium]